MLLLLAALLLVLQCRQLRTQCQQLLHSTTTVHTSTLLLTAGPITCPSCPQIPYLVLLRFLQLLLLLSPPHLCPLVIELAPSNRPPIPPHIFRPRLLLSHNPGHLP